MTLSRPHPDLLKQHPYILSLGIPDNDRRPPGRRVVALKQRVRCLKRVKALAIVAHDPASHEAAALARAAGGPPVARVLHTSLQWMPDEHRHALELLAPGTDLYFCVEFDAFRHATRLRRRAFLLPQPVDISRLNLQTVSARNKNVNRKVWNFLFVGRLEWAKGADILVQSAKTLTRALPSNFRIHILGDGPEFSDLMDTVRRLNLEKNVLFHGYRATVGDFYGRVDAVIIPSRGEGGSLVALEALASETPVIAAAVGGLRDLLRTYGLKDCLVPPGRPGPMAQAILDFIRHAAIRQKQIRHLRPVIIRNHDISLIGKWMKQTILKNGMIGKIGEDWGR